MLFRSEVQQKLEDSTKELATAQYKANVWGDTLAETTNALNGVYKEENLAIDEKNEKYAELTGKAERLTGVHTALTDEVEKQTSANEDLAAKVEEAQKTVDALDEELNKDIETFERYAEETDDATEATEKNTEAVQGNCGAMEIAVEKVDELTEAYRDNYESAHSSIKNQIGLFDDFALKVSEDSLTVDDMIGKMNAQTLNLSRHTENLQKAAAYGLSEGLVRNLAEATPESQAYLQTIIDEIERTGVTTEGLSEDAKNFVNEFNLAFAGTQTAKDSFAQTAAGLDRKSVV